jgi:hypothetical protein
MALLAAPVSNGAVADRVDLRFDPANALGSDFDALRKLAGLFESVDVLARVRDNVRGEFL